MTNIIGARRKVFLFFIGKIMVILALISPCKKRQGKYFTLSVSMHLQNRRCIDEFDHLEKLSSRNHK
jgi:hypothetical protein